MRQLERNFVYIYKIWSRQKLMALPTTKHRTIQCDQRNQLLDKDSDSPINVNGDNNKTNEIWNFKTTVSDNCYTAVFFFHIHFNMYKFKKVCQL